MTSELLVTAALAALPSAGGVGLMALLTNAGAPHPLRGPVALALVVWGLLAGYMALVFAT